MKHDRLRRDKAEIHSFDDLIRARHEGASHIGRDKDAFEQDVEIPDDLDVEEALTFPHPKHKKPETIDLMATHHESDIDEEWESQDLQPSDYEHDYNELTDAHLTDDPDTLAEEMVHTIGMLEVEDVTDRPTTDLPRRTFAPDEEMDL